MREIPVFKDTRLLEALDYIDRDLIAEVIADIKAPDADAVPGQSKKAVWRSVKQVLMLAACIVLISAFIPMVSYVIERYDISLGGIFGHDSTEETTVEEVTTEAETDHDHDHEEETTGSSSASTDKKEEEKKGLSTQSIITLCIFGALIVAAVVLGIIFREKVGKFLRVYKSETKKIVWLPWDQTKKSTLVVLIVLVACALAICLLDFALGQGYLAFLKLF